MFWRKPDVEVTVHVAQRQTAEEAIPRWLRFSALANMCGLTYVSDDGEGTITLSGRPKKVDQFKATLLRLQIRDLI